VVDDAPLWVHIVGWEKFQHADTLKRSTPPPWIKVYTRLLSEDDFLDLTEHRRLLLLELWLEYARTRARLRLDTRSISRRLHMRVTTADLDALNQAGYIEFRQDSVKTESRLDVDPDLERSKTLNAKGGRERPDAPAGATAGEEKSLERDNDRDEPLPLAQTMKVAQLVQAVGGGEEAGLKIKRTIDANGLSEADVVAAFEAATGRGVNDRLAVALSTLKKRAA
jgi:hypothetical protein